jgi:hypothetical protein
VVFLFFYCIFELFWQCGIFVFLLYFWTVLTVWYFCFSIAFLNCSDSVVFFVFLLYFWTVTLTFLVCYRHFNKKWRGYTNLYRLSFDKRKIKMSFMVLQKWRLWPTITIVCALITHLICTCGGCVCSCGTVALVVFFVTKYVLVDKILQFKFKWMVWIQ